MTDKTFESKIAFIVETDGLLKDYIESIVIKEIKSRMTNDSFKNLNTNHVQAALILKTLSPCSLKKFALTMRMSKAAASALVDRMVKNGMVQRDTNPENRRQVLLTISPEFDAHISHIRSEITRWFKSLTERIGMDTFEKWHSVMVTLNRVIQEDIHSDHEQNQI
ncbi:MarR family transcriptional regulator [Desulfotignum balticum]|jgi:DNA-binding MarR family transcriptional regulator|uniref:MarR family transcriptional regulator n=1 Tax=Desulfotignum balticum TaxID=115781 RepID=UPI0003F7D426|nr:MarR family transcriptional regulator [Desulfotignum balticum]